MCSTWVVGPAAGAQSLPTNSEAVLVQIAGHAEAWSRSPRWLRLEAGNLGERAYRLDDDKVEPPAAELIAFARAVLGPAEGIPADDLPACREPVRWRLLRDEVRGLGLDLPAAPTCAALERFADPRSVSAFEVWFVAPTSGHAAASFGHILLRLVRQPEPGAADTVDADIVYEISALTGMQHTPLDYIARGFAGGFPLVFEPRPMAVAVRDAVGREQRNIQRFRLNLTAAQRRQVLELLWQTERTLALPYRFLNRNCGTYLLWLLSTALDSTPALDRSLALWGAPAEVIDRLAAVRMGHDGKLLLQHVAGSLQSSTQVASHAAEAATAARAALQGQVPPELARQWQLAEGLGTAALTELARASLIAAPRSGPAIETVFLAQVLATRAAADQAQARADQIDQGRLRPIAGRPLPALREVLAWRKALYAHEDIHWRQARMAEKAAWVDDYLQHAPRRAATAAETAELAAAATARQRFEAATDAYAEVADLLGDAPSAASETGRERAHQQAEAARWHGAVVQGPSSVVELGFRRFAAVGGPTIRTAFWQEELGQWRPHGIGPLTTFVIADVETLTDWHGLHLGWLASKARLFELAVVTAQPHLALRPVLARVGWGIALLTEVRPRLVQFGARLDGYLLWLDGTRGAWLSGVRVGLLPEARIGGDDGAFGLAVAGEPFLQRRLGATGSVRGFLDARRTLAQHTLRAGLAADIPWGERESWRTRGELTAQRDVAGRWTPGWAAGLVW